MARIIKDPDNKWQIYIDWAPWKAKQEADTGDTLTITGSSWSASYPSGITQEAETPSTPSSDNKCFFVGSGGTVNLEYSLVNRITYSMTNLSVSDLTEDRTITFEIAEK